MITTAAAMAGVMTTLELVMGWAKKAGKAVAGYAFVVDPRNDSLVSFTAATRVEPITMIDQRVANLPYIGDVLQSLTSMFAGYYLQAIATLVNVGRVNVLRLLDSVNPTRDVIAAGSQKIADYIQQGTPSLLSLESYDYELPFIDDLGVSVEADNYNLGAHRPTPSDYTVALPHPKAAVTAAKKAKDADHFHTLGKLDDVKFGDQHGSLFGKDTLKSVNEATNLSVGKLLEVNIEDNGNKATIPVTIRLIAAIVGSPILVHILGDGSQSMSAKERYHAWRGGQLKFWRDLVMCQDLIDAHKKTLGQDTSGVYKEILARRTSNQASAALTASPSLATASNILVIDTSTLSELETRLNGRMASFNVRQAVFKSTYLMIMVVIDAQWERVTIYTRDIKIPTTLSVKEMKASNGSNKGTGPDIAEILKAYQLGVNPSSI